VAHCRAFHPAILVFLSPYELLVGLRYTRAKRRNRFISVISLISALGIMLGVAALIVVLSVMNGFQKELRTRILGVASHVQIAGFEGGLANWSEVARQASELPDVIAAAPFINQQGLIANRQQVQGALVRGILPEDENRVADIGRHMKLGALTDLVPGEFGIVLGSELAHAIGAGLGDKIVLIAPQGQVTPAGILPRIKQFTLVGVFEVGMYEYDAGLALIHLEDAQKLYRMPDLVSGVRLKLDDLFRAPQVARELLRTLRVDALVSDWTRSHANFFRAVQIEKRVMFIILTLIVLVSAFNLVSTLVMAVTEKQSDIAILRTLGATPSSIMVIFVIQGLIVGVFGTLLGVTLGVATALNVETLVPAIERAFNVQFLAKDVYYISDLPSDLHWADVWSVALVSLTLSLLATLYPSWRASRTNPAEALRYE
jgi:lipoprotein-releasing system permease protein